MKIRFIVGILTAVLFFSCDQYPIFHAISQEVKPTEPRIKGNPTAIVEINETMYVASRFGKTIHSYKDGQWSTSPSPPGGSIMELAGDGASLYALTGDPLNNTNVYVYESSGSNWSKISLTGGGGIIQTICGAGNGSAGYIFASTKSGLFFYKNTTPGSNFSNILSGLSYENIVIGAAFTSTTYYVAVVNKGIYTFDGNDLGADPVNGTAGKTIAGMIAVKDKIVAVTRDGSLLYGDSSGFTSDNKGVTFSGAMGIWKKSDSSTQHLLLVGIEGGIYSTVNGYREIRLASGALDPSNLGLGTPGVAEPTTVSNTDRYASTIGLRIVKSLYQAPDGTFFASTTKKGLWSYRGDVWNAEE